jgi:hypothetical protein
MPEGKAVLSAGNGNERPIVPAQKPVRGDRAQNPFFKKSDKIGGAQRRIVLR